MTDPLSSPAVRVRTMFAAALTAHLGHHLSADEMRRVAALSEADAEWISLFMRAVARQAEGGAMSRAPDTTPATAAQDREGELWTGNEDKMLIHRFRGGLSCEAIAVVHGRTEAAILTRLSKFRLVIYIPERGAWHKISETAWASRA